MYIIYIKIRVRFSHSRHDVESINKIIKIIKRNYLKHSQLSLSNSVGNFFTLDVDIIWQMRQ